MPEVDSLDQLNEQIKTWEADDEDRRISGHLHTIRHDFTAEQPLLRLLPTEVFEPGLVLNPRVDRSSMISVRMVKYSVPAHLIGRRVRVSLRATEVIVFEGRAVVAVHSRCVTRGTSRVVLDHYLEVLRFKPGALPGSTALVQARAAGVFTAAHEAFWAASRKVNGDVDGTRELVDVLLLHRSLTHEQVIAGITAALTVGAVSADVVAVEARRHTHDTTSVGGAISDRHHVARGDAREQRVVSLTQRRLTDPAAVIAGPPTDTRPVPSVAAYDELLPRRGATTPRVDDVKASTS
ncbi:transposase [Janibacter sp. HTCC2649]|nr:transposase [Janibacter sp. HTCC2649]